MPKMVLSETGREVELKSYPGERRAAVEAAQGELDSGDMSFSEFQDVVLRQAYGQEMDWGGWRSSEIAELSTAVLRYSTGGKDAVKNSLASGGGSQATA